MVFIPKTYPRAAGFQSEIGKMAVVHIAHLENDYRRQVHMAKMDMKKNIRELKHNRTMLRRSIRHYTSKLREYKKAKENKYYEGLLREKPPEKEVEVVTSESQDTDSPESDTDDVDESKVMSVENCTDGKLVLSKEKKGKENDPDFSDDLDGTKQEVSVETESVTEADHTHEQSCEKATQKEINAQGDRVSGEKVSLEENTEEPSSQDHEAPVEDLAAKLHRKRRSGVVNLVNITKLQYRPNVRALFRAVDMLARIHGIKQPDPKQRKTSNARKISHGQRTSVSTQGPVDHLTLPSQYLYNMKYGYSVCEDTLTRTSSQQAKNEDQTHQVQKGSPSRNSKNTVTNDHSGIVSPCPLPPISRIEFPTTEFVEKTERRKLSRNSAQSVLDSPSRPSRSSYNAHDGRNISSSYVKLPFLEQRTSVTRKTRDGVKISRSQLYSERYFERKFSAEDYDDVKWNTAFAKLKHVHFIDTTGL